MINPTRDIAACTISCPPTPPPALLLIRNVWHSHPCSVEKGSALENRIISSHYLHERLGVFHIISIVSQKDGKRSLTNGKFP